MNRFNLVDVMIFIAFAIGCATIARAAVLGLCNAVSWVLT